MSAAAAAPDRRWWIEAAGRVWGPYAQARLQGFVTEGRLGPSSLVSSRADGPFAPAALEPAIASVFHALQGEPAPVHSVPSAGAVRPVLVFAALSATRAEALEAALAAQGESLRVAAGLWLVRARCGAAPLRNVLSRRLREGDRLLVMEAAPEACAWFALDGDTDRELRRLLAGPRG